MHTRHENQKIIDQQLALLATHRDRLETRLMQQATHGVAWSPPEIRTDIEAARAEIRRIKHVLLNLGVSVADEPNDEAPSSMPFLQRVDAADSRAPAVGPSTGQHQAGFITAQLKSDHLCRRSEETFVYDAYISYAKLDPDRDWVREMLIPRLLKAGVRIVVDDDPRFMGVDKVTGLEQAIEQAKRTVLILSDAYLANNWASFERVMADHQGIIEGAYRLLPVLIAPLKQQREPLHIQRLIKVDMSQPQLIESGFKTLIAALQRPLPRTTP